MVVSRMLGKGLLLLTASTFLFTGMFHIVEACGLNAIPTVPFFGWAAPWWYYLVTGIVFTVIGIFLSFLYRRLKKRWNSDQY